ncbi:MAG: site-specific DNA-methyltransferase [Chloroflexi bacterium]|nr:site-specific DNA-methyltransferase [Chloroflexota bacterium]
MHATRLGRYYVGQCEHILAGRAGRRLKGRVQLLLTSPPFPLNNQKMYGNLNGERYLTWFTGLASLFSELLRDDGSMVIELGNAWEPGRPVQSLLPLQCLLGLATKAGGGLRLCQEFVCYNPARLPTPAEWVTVNRIRVTDSFTHIWWLSKSDFPKADNSRVLRPYSASMAALLERGSYNHGRRPSGHNIGHESFLARNTGSIMHNVIEVEPIDDRRPTRLPENVFSKANTDSNSFFQRRCREIGLIPHPARMPLDVAKFFITFLTDEDDLVLDPFAGSNVTGFCAEATGRQWVAIEANASYGRQSLVRFEDPSLIGLERSETNG